MIESGKKHKHTFTKLIAFFSNEIIYFISQSYNGSKNDLQLAEFPEDSFYKFLDLDERIGADARYRGLERIHPTILPFVQLSNQLELSKEEKEFNNERASVRVIVENVICQIKKWKCCRLPLRCKTTDIHIAQRFPDKIWTICCILINSFVESLRQRTNYSSLNEKIIKIKTPKTEIKKLKIFVSKNDKPVYSHFFLSHQVKRGGSFSSLSLSLIHNSLMDKLPGVPLIRINDETDILELKRTVLTLCANNKNPNVDVVRAKFPGSLPVEISRSDFHKLRHDILFYFPLSIIS
jgi:hypothetical protein